MIISTFKSIHKAYVDMKLDLSWDEICDLLTQHNDVNSKTDVELYNMVEFKDVTDPTTELARKYHYINNVKQPTYDLIPNTVRRCKNNVLSITGIVLDVDDEMTIDSVIELLDGIEYVLYTTFNHKEEKHKFRVVIPFSTPLLKDDIAGRQQSIINTFPGVDAASFTVSQSFYFHSGKTDCISFRNKGIMINPYDFEYIEPVVVTYQEAQSVEFTDEALQAYKNSVVSSLMSCSGLHYAGKGDNNKAVLTLISICRSVGMSFNEYDNICNHIAAPDSLLKNPTTRHNAWVGWTGDRIRKDTRDKFIKDYNGKPIDVQMNLKQQRQMEYEALMNILQEKKKIQRLIEEYDE